MLTKEIITITSKNDLTQVKAIQILMRVLLGKHPVPLFKVMNEKVLQAILSYKFDEKKNWEKNKVSLLGVVALLADWGS